jgi:hypothetical protein
VVFIVACHLKSTDIWIYLDFLKEVYMRTYLGIYRNLQWTICHFPKYEFCFKLLGTDLVNQQVMFIYMWDKQSELLEELVHSLQHRGINSVFSTQC